MAVYYLLFSRKNLFSQLLWIDSDTEHQKLRRKGEGDFVTDFHSAKGKGGHMCPGPLPLNNALKIKTI